MSLEELEYYRSRIAIEHELTANSVNPTVAGIHQQLAELYEKLVRIEDRRPTLGIVA